MPFATVIKRLNPCDRVSLSFILLLAVFLFIAREGLIPAPPDGYYHLGVAQQIVGKRTIPAWADWEYAPHGRPHLYPPLFHLLIIGASVPFGLDLLEGFRLVIAGLLPFALFSCWLLARTLFDSTRALVAMLLLGTDMAFMLQGLMGLPAVLAGTLVMLALAAYTRRRLTLAVLPLVLAGYTHLGVPYTAMLGLGLYALSQRDARLFTAKVVGIALLACAPILMRLFLYRDWLQHPIDLGIYGPFEGIHATLIKVVWLQVINLVVVGLFIWSCFRIDWRDYRMRLILTQALAALPILFSYGGRFLQLATPYLVILIAVPLSALLTPEKSRRRLATVCALAFAPTAVVMGFGSVLPPGVYPMVSGWMLAPIAVVAGRDVTDEGKRLGLPGFDEAQALALHIREHSAPDSIIHCYGARDLGIMVGFIANRRVDLGAWEEVFPNAQLRREIESFAYDDPTGIYLGSKDMAAWQNDASISWTAIGDYAVGLRKPSATGAKANGE